MNNYSLVTTLGSGSLLAFFLFFIFYKLLHWSGKMTAVTTAALMLLVYVPLSIKYWVSIDVFAIHFAFFMMIPYGLGIITAVHKEQRDEGVKNKGLHWIPGLIIVFFILLAVVDSIIISFATTGLGGDLATRLLPKGEGVGVGSRISSQFTGAVSNDLQDEEKQFDVYVKQLQKQRERGWRVGGGWDKPPFMNKASVFSLTVKERSGKIISGATVTSEFRRASDMKFDKRYTLKENNPGHYSAEVSLPLAGCWTMKILVIKGDDEHEIKGQTEVATLLDGKRITPECIDGAPDVDDKFYK